MKDWVIMWAIKLVVIGAAVSVVLLSGCSTVAGAGKDLTSAAEWTKEKISKDSSK
jgi:predicted small secreted protein